MTIVSNQLWTARTVEDTLRLYAGWASDYETDMAAHGYATPARVAGALAGHMPDRAAPVLDFGCGTGLSGVALKTAGFEVVDGTDASPQMIARAGAKSCYRAMWVSKPGRRPVDTPGRYAAITAVGVVSLGAAPAGMLDALLGCLDHKGLLVFSYNEATLRARAYQLALVEAQLGGVARLLSAQIGPHLPGKEGGRTSTVYVLERL